MQTVDWFWILHPALAVVLIYPLIGMVLRLGVQTRQRRWKAPNTPPQPGVTTPIWASGSRPVWCAWYWWLSPW